MEKAPKETKPNRVFRGRVVRAAIAEALDFGKGLYKPYEQPPEALEPELGVGAMDASQLPRRPETTQPQHWHNWDKP